MASANRHVIGLARYFPVKSGKVIIDLSNEVVNGILSKVDDEQIRKDVYTAGYQPDGTYTIKYNIKYICITIFTPCVFIRL